MSIRIKVEKPEIINRHFEAAEADITFKPDKEALNAARNKYDEDVIEAVKRKIEAAVEIPETENVLVYKQDIHTSRERTLEEALDFMVNMVKKAKRKIWSHNIMYELRAASCSMPDYYYTITMILEPLR